MSNSFGRLRLKLPFCHPDDSGCCYVSSGWLTALAMSPLTHAYDIKTRSYLGSPHYRPFVKESTCNAAFWYCFVVRLNKLLNKQSWHRWVQTPWRSSDVTVMSKEYRYVRRWEISGDGNIVNFIECSSFSAPISFEQLPVKSLTKSSSNCRYSRFTDIEGASITCLLTVKCSVGHTYTGMDD